VFPNPNAIKEFSRVNKSFPVFTGKKYKLKFINTFYLYLKKEFTEKINRRISPVNIGNFL